MPASISLICKVSALINNPGTVRAWLAAWRDWHINSRYPWAGENDLYLRKIRRGSATLAPAPTEIGRLRFHLWRTVLRFAATHKLFEFGAAVNLGYVFALRVPSELLGQCSSGKLSETGGQLSYGPIKRKGKLHLCTLRR